VVGDETALKVHVHTDDPGAALAAATAIGVLDEVEIANMHAQTAAREARLSSATTAPVAAVETGLVVVSQGSGNLAIFTNEKALVVEGGQTTNPDVGELVDAITRSPASAVIVLPNNSNVILAAREAAEASDKDVRVVPSRSIQAGLAALEEYDPDAGVDANESQMLAKLEAIETADVTIAVRDAHLDGVEIREGAYMGRVDGTVVAAGDDLEEVVLQVVARVADGHHTLLVVAGDGAPPLDDLVSAIEHAHPTLEPIPLDGGQPHYPLLFVAE
jgi:dihydroxyacetone kinase-like predicted kinase